MNDYDNSNGGSQGDITNKSRKNTGKIVQNPINHINKHGNQHVLNFKILYNIGMTHERERVL